jgi:outer membrane protein OmpA-like peptidoglycan-associated protein
MRPRRFFGFAVVGGVLATGLAACVALNSSGTTEAPTPMPLDHHNFNYALVRRESVQLIQAFDDGQQTYLQFTRAPLGRDQPVLVENSENQTALAYHCDGPYLVLPGVYAQLTISIGAKSAQVANLTAQSAPVAAVPNLAPPLTPAAEPSSTQAAINTNPVALQEDALQQRVGALVSAIEKVGRPDGSGAIVVRSDEGALSVVIRFGDNSSAVELDDELLRALGEAAQAANRVVLRGRTDATVATPTAGQLALRRALTVKEILVTEGVNPGRVRVFYRAAGDFEADDRLPEGRAANRRVEIELRRG